MDQRSKNKVKLFRTLKVVFYCLGLPLFIFAVIITAATEYVGEFAYAGLADTELFASMKVLFNGTALYGVWVAAGVWLLIAIVHIILVKTVKNRRARTMLVGIVTLVAMLARQRAPPRPADCAHHPEQALYRAECTLHTAILPHYPL